MTGIPHQSECDMSDPRQHVIWALHHLPNVGGVATVTHPSILGDWSEHIVKCGFVHESVLRELADENGYIHVDQLPKQQIKHLRAVRGPRHHMNAAAPWVPIDEKEPEPMRLPNIDRLTDQENEAMLAQYRAKGYLKDAPEPLDVAEELL